MNWFIFNDFSTKIQVYKDQEGFAPGTVGFFINVSNGMGSLSESGGSINLGSAYGCFLKSIFGLNPFIAFIVAIGVSLHEV